MNNVVIYGGTFDPIHWGHLNTALYLQTHLQCQEFKFMPAKSPVLKSPCSTTPHQRLTMLQLALAPYPQFSIDERELNRKTPSYMVETLIDLRKEYGKETALSIVMGQDAFNHLPQWHRWTQLIKLANLIIIERPSHYQMPLAEQLHDYLAKHLCTDPQRINTSANGLILPIHAGTYAISSTEIREKVQHHKSIKEEVPSTVAQYIKTQGLYQLDDLEYPPS